MFKKTFGSLALLLGFVWTTFLFNKVSERFAAAKAGTSRLTDACDLHCSSH